MIRCGRSCSQVSVTCTLLPIQAVCRLMLMRASGSYGEAISREAGGMLSFARKSSWPSTWLYCCTHTRRNTSTAGMSRSQLGACSEKSACEPLAAIRPDLPCDGLALTLLLGPAVVFDPAIIAVVPVRRD